MRRTVLLAALDACLGRGAPVVAPPEPESAASLLQRADAQAAAGQLEDALSLASEARDAGATLGAERLLADIWARQGDHRAALRHAEQAVTAAESAGPDAMAHALTAYGWLLAVHGDGLPRAAGPGGTDPMSSLNDALALAPADQGARLARGRLRLYRRDWAGAREDLALAGDTMEARWSLFELDPSTDVEAVCQDDRALCALWRAARDPDRARLLLTADLPDTALARVARAYLHWLGGADASAEARSALDTGMGQPRVLLYAGLITRDPAMLHAALATGPGLQPSEIAMARAALPTRRRGAR